jgi:hypothetical protein
MIARLRDQIGAPDVRGHEKVPVCGQLAWTALGAVTITVWPAAAAWRPSWRPLSLSTRNTVIVTAAFLSWMIIGAQGSTAPVWPSGGLSGPDVLAIHRRARPEARRTRGRRPSTAWQGAHAGHRDKDAARQEEPR